jgi:hypothetical protein
MTGKENPPATFITVLLLLLITMLTKINPRTDYYCV